MTLFVLLNKPVTLHWLPNSYATHVLENDTDIRRQAATVISFANLQFVFQSSAATFVNKPAVSHKPAHTTHKLNEITAHSFHPIFFTYRQWPTLL
jgi:hypothetical protein